MRARPRRAGKLPWVVLSLAVVIVIFLVADRVEDTRDPVPAGYMSWRSWSSGAWTGGEPGVAAIEGFGQWRGSPADEAVYYAGQETWQSMRDSNWHVAIFNGFAGRLVYGVPLLPKDEPASLKDVAAGLHDDVWHEFAAALVRNNRENSYVRIGWEANGTWYPWGATAETAADFRAAYIHVAEILRHDVPQAVLGFDIACGTRLEGAEDNRLSALTMLYPGDDVVDVIGCTVYDSFEVRIRTAKQWAAASRPDDRVGVLDVADFARAHGKRFAVPEWGLTGRGAHGSGDNPFFIYTMFRFFQSQRDILEFENYFNESDTDLDSSIYGDVKNPDSAKLYRSLW